MSANLKALLADAVTVINAYRVGTNDTPKASAAELARLEEALGTDCHGELYAPDIQLKVEEPPSEIEKLTDHAMETFPAWMVSNTKDIHELIGAAGDHIVALEGQLEEQRKGFADAIAELNKACGMILENLTADWTVDKPGPEDKAIAAAHPVHTNAYPRYARAMQLVGRRVSKYAIVDLVNWLLMRAEEKKG